MTKKYTFNELCAALPDLTLNQEFVTDYGSKLYVAWQGDDYSRNKTLFWKSDDSHVQVAEIVVGTNFTEVSKYTEISFTKAMNLIEGRLQGFDCSVYVSGWNEEILPIDEYTIFDRMPDNPVDLADLLNLNFYTIR